MSRTSRVLTIGWTVSAFACTGGSEQPGSAKSDAATKSSSPVPTSDQPDAATQQPEGAARPEPEPMPAAPQIEAAGLRVQLPMGWLVEPEDDPRVASARAPTGDLRCLIEWWPAGYARTNTHVETIDGARQSVNYEGTKFARSWESDDRLLLCTWSGESEPIVAVVDEIFESAVRTEGPAFIEPEWRAGDNPYRELCTYRLADGPGSARGASHTIVLDRDGRVWLADLSGRRLRAVAGEDYQQIACSADVGAGLLLGADGSVHGLRAPPVDGPISPTPEPALGMAVSISPGAVLHPNGKGTFFHYGEWRTEDLWTVPKTWRNGDVDEFGHIQAIRALIGSPFVGGCALTKSGVLWCWGDDDRGRPPVPFEGPGHSYNEHTGEAAYGPQPIRLDVNPRELIHGQLRQRGDAMCVAAKDTWYCVDQNNRHWDYPTCAAQPCRCIVLSNSVECSDKPRLEASANRPRIEGVVLHDDEGSCVVLDGGKLVCLVDGNPVPLEQEAAPPSP